MTRVFLGDPDNGKPCSELVSGRAAPRGWHCYAPCCPLLSGHVPWRCNRCHLLSREHVENVGTCPPSVPLENIFIVLILPHS